ncbi:TPA: HEAT repeat domain-containing protein [Candidatus Poribacteria bacterium]|nr:HEAT repeat domain-containing protein [Candidatus Poribacteria bacterium]
MEQFLQILQFLKMALWPNVLITIVLAFIATVIIVLLKNSFEHKRALPGVEDSIESIPADRMYKIVYGMYGEIRKLTGPDSAVLRDKPELQLRLKKLDDLQRRMIKESVLPVISASPQDFPVLAERISESVQSAFAKGLVAQFWTAVETNERFSRLQHISQMVKWVDDEVLEDLADEVLTDEEPQLRGEMCYTLGKSGKIRFKGFVQRLLEDTDQWVRKQAAEALEQLEQVVDEKRHSDVSPPEASYLHEQVDRLVEEVAELRKEIAKVRSEPQLDDYTRAVIDEFEQNRDAYEQEEASLLEKYNGQFVAFCHGKLVAVGPDRKQVIQEAMQAEPTARPYIRQVGVEIPVRPADRH